MKYYFLIWQEQRDRSLKLVAKRHVTVVRMLDLIRLEFAGCEVTDVSELQYNKAYPGMRP